MRERFPAQMEFQAFNWQLTNLCGTNGVLAGNYRLLSVTFLFYDIATNRSGWLAWSFLIQCSVATSSNGSYVKIHSWCINFMILIKDLLKICRVANTPCAALSFRAIVALRWSAIFARLAKTVAPRVFRISSRVLEMHIGNAAFSRLPSRIEDWEEEKEKAQEGHQAVIVGWAIDTWEINFFIIYDSDECDSYMKFNVFVFV
jgi:hypothetical protein